MVANIRGFTPTYGFKLINFDTPRWHTLEYANWNQLDAMFLQVGVPGMRGEWQNSTSYLPGERVFDVQTSDLYRCLVEHISPTTGTFADARAANPGFWVLQTLGVPLFRGDWTSGVQYSLGDLVKVDNYRYNLCVVRHVSSLSFSADILFWILVFDATATINDANQAASDASDSENAAALSATAAATSATAAATSATNADTDAFAAHQDAVAAGVASGQAVTSASEAAVSATTATNQAAALRGTSLTSNTVSAGAKTFITQAGKQFNVGNFVTIVATANPNGQMVTGSITAYSGTSLGVNITGFLGSGTIADWQIYVSGMQGQKGADGAGGGGIPDAAADGVLYGRVNNTWQASIKRAGDTMAGHLVLPTSPGDTNAVRKDYVDGAISTIDLSTRVLKAGDTMTGHLSLPITPAAANAVRKDYVDGAISGLVIPPATTAASVAEYLTGTNNAKMVTPKTAWDAAATTFSLGTGASVTPNFSNGIDFTWSPTAASVTMGNPTSVKVGQKGVIYIIPGTVNTAITWGTNFKFAGGIKPTLSTVTGSVDTVSYVCRTATFIACTFSADMK